MKRANARPKPGAPKNTTRIRRPIRPAGDSNYWDMSLFHMSDAICHMPSTFL